MSTFKSVVTTLGQARIAAAIAAGTDINITQLAVGDGNGKATTPVASQTKLVKEVYRTPLNSLKLEPSHGNWVIAEAVLSASVGGFWMREMGLFSSDGALIAVCNMADTYKPTLAEGSGRTQTLRMVIAVSNTEAISLLIDDSVIMATEQYVNDLLAAHEKSRNHPDGTTTAKGFVQLSSSVSSTSEALAATPKAVKAANDNANGRLPSGGTAVAATKLATARKIAGLAFDGTKDVNITATDVGALAPGDFGVGSYGKSVQDANAIDANGFYLLPKGADNAPVAGTHAEVIHAGYDNNSAKQIAWRAGGSSVSRMYHRAKSAGKWGEYTGVYDESNKPTAEDVGALPSGGTAAAATKLATARKIAGVAFDGTKDISITAANVGAVQQGGGTGMSSNTIRIGWSGKKLLAQVDSIQMGELYYTNNPPSADAVGALPAEGTAAAATKLATARKIAGVAFDGTKDISISAGNVGALPSGGTAVAATKLATARKIAGVAFDGTKDITLSNSSVGLGNVGNFAAVQQGGGIGMGTNKIYIGWTGAKIKIQVDASDMGEVYTTQNKPPFVDAYSKTESNAHYIARDSVKTAGFASGNVANPYMRHEASDAVVYLADRNWSDSRFVYDVQRGSQALENAGWTAQQNWEAPTGCFMTGLNIRPDMGDCRMMGKYYRALMIRSASGSWRQVGN